MITVIIIFIIAKIIIAIIKYSVRVVATVCGMLLKWKLWHERIKMVENLIHIRNIKQKPDDVLNHNNYVFKLDVEYFFFRWSENFWSFSTNLKWNAWNCKCFDHRQSSQKNMEVKLIKELQFNFDSQRSLSRPLEKI